MRHLPALERDLSSGKLGSEGVVLADVFAAVATPYPSLASRLENSMLLDGRRFTPRLERLLNGTGFGGYMLRIPRSMLLGSVPSQGKVLRLRGAPAHPPTHPPTNPPLRSQTSRGAPRGGTSDSGSGPPTPGLA